jgi:hypothetical protein
VIKRILFVAATAGLIAACQSSGQSRQQQLAALCADPSNRAPRSDYFMECQSLYPLTNAQRAKLYQQTAPQ